MSNSYKNFTSADVATTKTLLHEVVPLTGTIVSGTYSDNMVEIPIEIRVYN